MRAVCAVVIARLREISPFQHQNKWGCKIDFYMSHNFRAAKAGFIGWVLTENNTYKTIDSFKAHMNFISKKHIGRYSNLRLEPSYRMAQKVPDCCECTRKWQCKLVLWNGIEFFYYVHTLISGELNSLHFFQTTCLLNTRKRNVFWINTYFLSYNALWFDGAACPCYWFHSKNSHLKTEPLQSSFFESPANNSHQIMNGYSGFTSCVPIISVARLFRIARIMINYVVLLPKHEFLSWARLRIATPNVQY